MHKYEFFQEEIYRINREIDQFADLINRKCESEPKKEIIPSAFNTLTFSANYFAVHKSSDNADNDRWIFSKNTKNNINSFLDKHNDELINFIGVNHFNQTLLKHKDRQHYFLINLYNNFPIKLNLFFDAIVRNALSKFVKIKKSIKFVFADIIEPHENRFKMNYFPWVDMRFFYDTLFEELDIGVIASQEKPKDNFYQYGNWLDGVSFPNREVIMKSEEVEKVIAFSEVETHQYFFRFLMPLFLGYPEDQELKNPMEKLYDGKDGKLYNLKGQKALEVRHFLIIPFYDSWIDGEPCGSLQGNLNITSFPADKKYTARIKFIEQIKDHLNWPTQTLPPILFESRTHDMLKFPIHPGDDFLQDFIRKTAFVQIWDRIIVFDRSTNPYRWKYCFKRLDEEDSEQLNCLRIFEICHDYENNACKEICNIPEGLKSVFDRKEDNTAIVFKHNGKGKKNFTYYYCLNLNDILDPRILPSIEGFDTSSYNNHVLCFQFPKDVFFPLGKNSDRHCDCVEGAEKLGKQYINKLIPIFDKLLLKHSFLKHSVKSAVSAIMSRNMSHNLGSHVLARISADNFSDFCKSANSNETTAEKRKEISSCAWCFQSFIKYLFRTKEVIETIEPKEKSHKELLTWGKDVQFLTRYLQQRMDFIALASTDWPEWTDSVYLLKGLLRWFLSQKHLLNFIAASEGLKAHLYDGDNEHPDIRIHAYIVSIENWNSSSSSSSSSSSRIKTCLLLTEKKEIKICFADDPLLAIPGGIVGHHAFYIILENVIRNAAKHNIQKNHSKNPCITHLDVIIELLDDPFNEVGINLNGRHVPSWLIRIYDNVSKLNDGDLILWGNKESNTLGINDRLSTSIISESGKLRRESWGLAEMKIAAGFLQRRNIDHIGSANDQIVGERINLNEGDMDPTALTKGREKLGSIFIIRAVPSPQQTLAFEFYLPKPRNIGICCFN